MNYGKVIFSQKRKKLTGAYICYKLYISQYKHGPLPNSSWIS